jgi:hypothetical protein
MSIKKISMIRLDIWASMMWFCMDFFWMWEYPKIAVCFIPITIVLIFLIVKRTKSITTLELTIISVLWFCMNSTWLISEFFNQQIIIFLKVIASSFGITAFFKLIYLNKSENLNNFKRLL